MDEDYIRFTEEHPEIVKRADACGSVLELMDVVKATSVLYEHWRVKDDWYMRYLALYSPTPPTQPENAIVTTSDDQTTEDK